MLPGVSAGHKQVRDRERRRSWDQVQLTPASSMTGYRANDIWATRAEAEGPTGFPGAPWNPSTVHGNPVRGTGILNNELYVGRLVWNRLRYVKDPDTGKRVSRPNPPTDWVTTAVPDLRIVDDELWTQVKARQVAMRRVASNGDPKRFNQARRPKYLFSGLTKCAECGGGYVMYWRDRLACFGARSRGTCTNRLTISRPEVEERVLAALRDKLMPGSVRGLLSRVRARAESAADGASSGTIERPQPTRQRRKGDPQTRSGDQGRCLGVIDQRRAPVARGQERRTAVPSDRARDAGAASPGYGRRVPREGREPLSRSGD